MKICVFGAASAHIDQKYITAVEELGEELARRGHSLVFGCGCTGLMGAAARGVKRGGGYIHGVVPEFFKEEGVEQLYLDCDKITYTKDMSERKRIMEDEAEAFVITPGGVGTFEEFFEVITLKQLGRHNKAVAMFNIDGYFDTLSAFMREICDRKFITKSCLTLAESFTSAAAVLDYIEGYKPEYVPFYKLKTGD